MQAHDAVAQDAPPLLDDAIQQMILDAARPELDSFREAFTLWASLQDAKLEEFMAAIREVLAARQQQFAEQVRSPAAAA